MTRMKIARQDRPRVKLQCLRLLANLRLDPEKSALIERFVLSYLQLNEREVRIFNQAVEILPKEERQAVMSITNHWEAKGIQKGLAEGLRLGISAALRLGYGPPQTHSSSASKPSTSPHSSVWRDAWSPAPNSSNSRLTEHESKKFTNGRPFS